MGSLSALPIFPPDPPQDDTPRPIGYSETLTVLLQAYGPTMSARQVAVACSLVHGRGVARGEPNPRLVLELVHCRRLRPVDRTQPQHRWVFASAAVAAHIVGGTS